MLFKKIPSTELKTGWLTQLSTFYPAQPNVQYTVVYKLKHANTRCGYLIISLEQAQCGNYIHTIVRCTDVLNSFVHQSNCSYQYSDNYASTVLINTRRDWSDLAAGLWLSYTRTCSCINHQNWNRRETATDVEQPNHASLRFSRLEYRDKQVKN